MSTPPDPTLDPITLAAQEAARALQAMGWPVRVCVDGEGAWRIRDAILTHDELVSFAIWAPNPTINELTGSAPLHTRRDPHAPLDVAEALETIRAVIGVKIASTADDEAIAFRLIRSIVARASRTGEA